MYLENYNIRRNGSPQIHMTVLKVENQYQCLNNFDNFLSPNKLKNFSFHNIKRITKIGKNNNNQQIMNNNDKC